MKICFTIPNAHIGGFRTFAINLGRQFRKDGHNVSALIATRGHEPNDLGDINLIQQEMDLHLCLQKNVVLRSRFLRKVIQTIEKIAPDVLILNHTMWPLAALPYLPVNIVRIMVVHSVMDEELREPKANSNWWDTIVAVGPGVYKILLDTWSQDKVRFIPVGVNASSLQPRQEFTNLPLQICYIGRLSQSQKNILLIPIIARVLVNKGVKFHISIVGEGEDGSALRAKINDLELLEYFTFWGACTHMEVENILSKQNILILPSNTESIGHVIQEAQMMGVVPVASHLKLSTDYVITEGEDGRLCDPGNADDFVSAIIDLYKDRIKMKRLSENGRRNVRQRFAIAIIAKQYYQLFKDIKYFSNRDIMQKKPFMGFYSIPDLLLPPRYTTIYRIISKKLSS